MNIMHSIFKTKLFLCLICAGLIAISVVIHRDIFSKFNNGELEGANGHRSLSILSDAITFLNDHEIKPFKQKIHLEQSITFLDPNDLSKSAAAQAIHKGKKKSKDMKAISKESIPHVDLQAPTPVSPSKDKKTNFVSNIEFLDEKIHTLASETALTHRKHHNKRQEQSQMQQLIKSIPDHPYVSPRVGTDIDNPETQVSILQCPNQSKCIVPELQLQHPMYIYFCRHPVRSGVRFYYLVKEGLLLHPNVILVSYEQIHLADYIIYLPGSAPWHLTECNDTSYAKKLIVLDEFDGHTLFVPASNKVEYEAKYGSMATPWYYIYFKRSFVRRLDGRFVGYPHLTMMDVYPLVYSIAEAYVNPMFTVSREIEILCTLRGSKHMITRLRVQEWVAEYGQVRSIPNVISGQINTATRTEVNTQYFQQMYNAKIIVTVNPANWEGDFRLWESLATGALIFVDPLFVPHPFPLLHGVHVIYFDNNNKTDLFMKLDYYRTHWADEGKRIAMAGYLHAMKYHRTVSMIDYFLRSVHVKNATTYHHQQLPAQQQSSQQSSHAILAKIPVYHYTGQYLDYEAKMQQAAIKNCHRPGIYADADNVSGKVKRLEDCGTSMSKESNQISFLE